MCREVAGHAGSTRWHVNVTSAKKCVASNEIQNTPAMVDYSKWDNLQDSDDDADVLPKSALPSSTPAAAITQQVRPSVKNATTLLLIRYPFIMPAQVMRDSAPQPETSAALAQHFSSETRPQQCLFGIFNCLQQAKKGPSGDSSSTRSN